MDIEKGLSDKYDLKQDKPVPLRPTTHVQVLTGECCDPLQLNLKGLTQFTVRKRSLKTFQSTVQS